MSNKIGYGDYKLLKRLADGEKIILSIECNWTMRELGLIESVSPAPDEKKPTWHYTIATELGRAYLKRNKQPPFPLSVSDELVLMHGAGI